MLNEREELYDVTIIGGGPAGLFAAFYAGLRELKTKIIEALPELGGKVLIYPQKMIWDVGGLTPVPGSKLIGQLVEQGMTFHPTVELEQTVTHIHRTEGGMFELQTDRGKCHYSRTIIVAIGGGGVIRPVKLTLHDADVYEDKNLYYRVQNIQDFKGKVVLISGGGPAAVDWANDIAPIAKKVYLVFRGQQLKAHEAGVSKLSRNGIHLIPNTEIHELKGSHRIDQVVLKNNQTEQTTELHVEAVLVNHGYEQDNSLFKNSNLGLTLVDEYYVRSHPNGETNIPGLFAAGDCIHYDGKLMLIAGAFQDAVNAVNRAKLYLDPEANSVAMVSTHHAAFAEKNKKYLYQ